LAGLTLTFHLLFGSSGVAGSTGHADVVPMAVLEKDLSIPPCQGAGLRERQSVKSQSRGAHDLRHQRRDAGDEAFGSLGEQSPGGQLEQHGCSSSNGRGSLILLSEKLKKKSSLVPLSFPSQAKKEISYSLTTTCIDSA